MSDGVSPSPKGGGVGAGSAPARPPLNSATMYSAVTACAVSTALCCKAAYSLTPFSVAELPQSVLAGSVTIAT